MEFKEITDENQWNDIATQYEGASFFDSWTWTEFEETMGNEIWRFGVFEDDICVGLLPLKKVIGKRGKLLQLRDAPLIDWNNEILVNTVFEYLKDHARSHGLQFIRIEPLLSNTTSNNELLGSYGLKLSSSHNVAADLSIVLDLRKEEEDLLSEMRKNTRYSIRKAEKEGVTITHTDGDERFDEFWDIFIDSAQRNNWNRVYSKKYIKSEFDLFRKRGQSMMFFAEYNDEAIAAGIFNFFNGKVAYHHSGSLTKYRDIPSMYSLIWEVVKYSKTNGYKELNLWGVVEKDDIGHPWYGLSLFKRGFGGQELRMVHARDLIIRPFAYVTRMYERLENRARGF
jgi:lipid II:glycine glycyltransferase (peptidoglycan interpeptide bridge formation enzyme)